MYDLVLVDLQERALVWSYNNDYVISIIIYVQHGQDAFVVVRKISLPVSRFL